MQEKISMDTQELKLQLIQWILEINNQETLELLWLWKDRQKQEREAMIKASYGAWQSDESADDLINDIYESRYFEEKDIDL